MRLDEFIAYQKAQTLFLFVLRMLTPAILKLRKPK